MATSNFLKVDLHVNSAYVEKSSKLKLPSSLPQNPCVCENKVRIIQIVTKEHFIAVFQEIFG